MKHELFIDGELKDTLGWTKHYLEAETPDGIKINVAVGRRYPHISFSNGEKSIDI